MQSTIEGEDELRLKISSEEKNTHILPKYLRQQQFLLIQEQRSHVRLNLQLKQATEIASIESFMIAIDKGSKPNAFCDSFTCLISQIWKSL